MAVRIRRVRTYYVDPGWRKKRVYTFRAERTEEREPYRVGGRPYGRKRRVRYEGYGHTPKKAEIALRKHRKRREPRDIITKEDLARERRLAEKWKRDHTITPGMRKAVTDWLIRKSKEETGG